MTTNTPNPRKLVTTGRGGANYFWEYEAPAEWLVASIPGADEAREAWHAENAKGAELYRQWSASGTALVALRASDPRASELEEAERAYKELDKALETQARKALAALRRFDALVYTGLGTPAEYQAKAAERALAKHAEALAAYETLFGALKERDRAHAAAGSPGRDWRNSARINYRSVANLATVVRPALEGFDVHAVQTTAEGDRVPSHAEQIVAAREAAEELSAKAASATRRRTIQEGY